MQLDWLDTGSNMVYVGLATIGIMSQVKQKFAERFSTAIILGFVALTSIGLFFSNRQSARATAARERSDAHLEELGRSMKETSRLQGVNTTLQGELMKQSGKILSQGDRITELARENVALGKRSVDSLVGGDSFSYLTFSDHNQIGAIPVIRHNGAFPLYDVEAVVADIDEWKRKGSPKTIAAARAARTHIVMKIGNLSPGNTRVDALRMPFSSQTDQKFNITFTARSGFWKQILRLRRIDGRWLSATKVVRAVDKKEKVVMLEIDDGFPKKDLDSDTDWTDDQSDDPK